MLIEPSNLPAYPEQLATFTGRLPFSFNLRFLTFSLVALSSLDGAIVMELMFDRLYSYVNHELSLKLKQGRCSQSH